MTRGARVAGASRRSVYGSALLTAPLQVRLDERVDVAVEHGLDVAGLEARALVLHELVRLQRVGADLVAERDVALLPRERDQLGVALLPLALGEARREDLHRARLVLRLRSLVLARHDDAGRKVRDP